jgi:hypothetical protein
MGSTVLEMIMWQEVLQIQLMTTIALRKLQLGTTTHVLMELTVSILRPSNSEDYVALPNSD